MRSYTKPTLSILIAALALSLAAGTAAARRGLRVSPRESIVFFHNLEFIASGKTTQCDLTLNVTLHDSIAKTTGSLAGYTRIGISTGACSAGNMGLLVGGRQVSGLQGPYHFQYVSFSGELPNITSVTFRVVGVEFWIESPERSIACLSNGAVAISMESTGGNPATGMRMNAQSFPLRGGIFNICSISTAELRAGGEIYRELEHVNRQSVTITLF